MHYNKVKRIVMECPALVGLDEVSQAFLLRHGEEMVFDVGDIIYDQGAELDDSFCVLLAGSVAVERDGKELATRSTSHVFGDMAYFSQVHKRAATVRATSRDTSVLRVQLKRDDFDLPAFASLKKFLALQPWKRPVE